MLPIELKIRVHELKSHLRHAQGQAKRDSATIEKQANRISHLESVLRLIANLDERSSQWDTQDAANLARNIL